MPLDFDGLAGRRTLLELFSDGASEVSRRSGHRHVDSVRAAEAFDSIVSCLLDIIRLATSNENYSALCGRCEELGLYVENFASFEGIPSLVHADEDTLLRRLAGALQARRGMLLAQELTDGRRTKEAAIRELDRVVGTFRAAATLIRARAPVPSRAVTFHNHGEVQVGDKYETRIVNSTVSGAAIGRNNKASVASPTESPSQEQHRQAIGEAQGALVRDQDALERIDSRMFDALNQFLVLARKIQVEQESLGQVQATMKSTLDEVWAEHVAKGMKPQLLPKTLEVVGAIAANPVMSEVAKKLIGL